MTIAEWAARNRAEQPSLSGQLGAMRREAMADMHATLMQSYFGQQPGASAPGTPLSPTQAAVNQDLGNVHGYDQQLGEYANRAPAQGAEQTKGIER